MTHLRYSGASPTDQTETLLQIIKGQPHLMDVLRAARALDLPDCWLVSGAIYNTVWNVLTGRNPLTGIKDIDLFYFDPDVSWDAEDKVIRRAEGHFAPAPPVEIRNQARVHLWYEDHFGEPYPPLRSAREGIDRFACRTHAIGARLMGNDQIELYAPYGLDDVFSFRVVPNPILNNRATHEAKAARQKAIWPELTILPWPQTL